MANIARPRKKSSLKSRGAAGWEVKAIDMMVSGLPEAASVTARWAGVETMLNVPMDATRQRSRHLLHVV
ncbi:protein of unknown function [Candidatus Filomicrobium marinum]|nr:hypothetical protein [Filomicrobium sp.]MCV0370060.1 hypothetical protein [Filomicrobium sp.]CFX27167.1 protein of unknown function [Candidatus Filomicrobium marinum]